jgi:hypothetical protein
MNIKYLGIFVLINIPHFYSLSQESTNTTSTSIKSTDGNISYSIGQVFYSEQKSNEGKVNQDVQQAYIITALGIENLPNINISVFPNPTTDKIQLKVDKVEGNQLRYELVNNDGKSIAINQINSEEVVIDMKTLPVAVYYLNILDEKNKLKSFKIIKNN